MKQLESSAQTSQAKTQDVMMPSNLISANAEKIYPLHLALADVKMLVDRHLGSRRKKGGQAGRWHRGCHRLHAEFQSLRYCFDIQAGIDIICGKPMTAKVEDALELVKMQRQTGLMVGMYTFHAMLRQAGHMVRAARLARYGRCMSNMCRTGQQLLSILHLRGAVAARPRIGGPCRGRRRFP